MVVIKVLVVFADGVAHVTFHDLHVVDVVEEFEPFGTEAAGEFPAPGNVVALIILVVAFAVQQFHAQRDR